MKQVLLLILTIILLLTGSCSRKTAKVSRSEQNKPELIKQHTLPPCIIYKTKEDYSKQVPVALSADKSIIASYPDVHDIFIRGDYPYPAKLDSGFFLDNRGIGPDVAFLDYTYEAYHALGTTPGADELMKHLLDRDPLLEMYQCGNKSSYTNLAAELNAQIRSDFKNCKKLK
jgi:hypothetical protein